MARPTPKGLVPVEENDHPATPAGIRRVRLKGLGLQPAGEHGQAVCPGASYLFGCGVIRR
jgi:hypothetical protein